VVVMVMVMMPFLLFLVLAFANILPEKK